MVILVLNCGSSSIKYQVIDMEAASSKLLAKGIVERIGLPEGDLTHKPVGKEPFELHRPIPDHTTGIKLVLDALTDPVHGVIGSLDEVKAVGHRVAHGGEFFPESCIVTEEVKSKIRSLFEIAPLHNPANLEGVLSIEKVLPGVPQVTVFDTSFHQTLPATNFMYALPYEYYQKYGIRKYGFHGTSHRFIAGETPKFLGKKPEDCKFIICHLGNGSSLSAIVGGKVVDTSMGLTPLEGLMMGGRTGDIDPAVVFHLIRNAHMNVDELDALFNKRSGMMGMTGYGDLREVHRLVSEGNEDAKLALDVYVHRIVSYIGNYTAQMGGVDVITFTAGVGENDDVVRKMVCDKLAPFGVKLDEEKNATRSKEPRIISTPDSSVIIAVIPTNEELMIARDTKEVIEK